MAFIDYQNITSSPYAGMFDSYWNGEGTDYSVKSQYAPYMTNVAGGEYQAKGFDFNQDAYNQYLSSQPAVGGGTMSGTTASDTFTPMTYTPQQALEAYKTAVSGSQPYGGAGLPSDVLRQAQSILGDSMWGGVENYLTNTYTNPNSFQFGPGFEWGTNLSATDPLAFLGNTYIGGQNSWAQQDFTNKMLQSIMTPEQYAQLAPTQQNTGRITDDVNVVNQDDSFSMPLPVMIALGLMTGGAAGLFGAAGTLAGTAAGGGIVGAGLEGAALSGLGGIGGSLGGGLGMAGAGEGLVGWGAGGEALAGGLGEVGSLAGTGTALGGGEGLVGWDALGNAAAGGTGEVGSLAGAGGSAGGVTGSEFSDFGSNFGPTGDGLYAPTSDPGLTGGGWTAADGSFGTNGLTDIIKQIQSIQQNMPPGSTDILKTLTGQMGGGSGTGTGGTGTGGTGSMADSLMNWLTGTGTGSLGGLATGLMQYGEYGDQGDFLKNTMERAISASDPYGYGPYRKYAADQLQKTYTDPASIYASPEMQALDQMFMDKTMAGQSASGNLFNAPERVSQRQNNFYSNLKDYRQPLMQMSGSQFRPDTRAYYEFAGPIVQNALNESASLGGAISSGIGGLSSILGGMGGSGGTTGGGGGMDLSSIWNTISGGGFGGGLYGSPTGGDWTAMDFFGGGSGDTSSFYNATDLLDLWL